jgi:hypothetical protein
MSTRGASWLAWALAGLCVAMFLASISLHLLARSTQSPGDWITVTGISYVLSFVSFLAFPS